MNSFVTLAHSMLQFVFVCERVVRACVQCCERTSVHPAELVGVVGACVVSCARGQLSLSRSCSSFSVLVEERSSIAWKTKTLCCRRLLGRRRLCALVDCLEDEDFVLSSIAWKTKTLCSRRLLGRRRLCALVDCLEDENCLLSSIAWNLDRRRAPGSRQCAVGVGRREDCSPVMSCWRWLESWMTNRS